VQAQASVLDGGGWLAPRPVRFARGKEEEFAPELSERVYKIKFLAITGVRTFERPFP
jgi:hypothetical protein